MPHVKPLLAAASGQAIDRYPIWFLRQAGRYLPEYRELRKPRSFLDLCMDPRLAAEVTLQPLRRFDLDGSIIFSDILMPPTALGQSLTFDAGHGPILSNPIRSRADFNALRKGDVHKELGYVADAIALVKASLKPHQTMIGFAGAPFTVATYMIEGSSSKNMTEVKRLCFCERDLFLDVLKRLRDVTALYVQMQVEAGAEIIMLFDTWAASLCEDDYADLVLPITAELFAMIRSFGVPLIYYPGQGLSHLLHMTDKTPVDVAAIDWRMNIGRAIKHLYGNGFRGAVQGNLDPQVLIGSQEFVKQRVRNILEDVQKHRPNGHIFNVGHGLLPHTPIESIQAAIEQVRSFRV